MMNTYMDIMSSIDGKVADSSVNQVTDQPADKKKRETLGLLGKILLVGSMYTAAKTAEAILPKSVYAGDSNDKYEILAKKAEKLNQEKKYNEAIKLLSPYVEDKQNKSALFFNEMGLAHKQIKQYKNAVQFYRQAVQLKPRDPSFHYNLGVALYYTGELEKSVLQFDKVLELNPNHQKAFKSRKYIIKHLKS